METTEHRNGTCTDLRSVADLRCLYRIPDPDFNPSQIQKQKQKSRVSDPSRLQKKPPAHKRGHPTLQNMNFFYFCGSFLPSWIRIRIQVRDPDPEPMVRLNTDPIRIRIRIRIRNPAKERGKKIFWPYLVMSR
jgi:hypothetical protein